MKSYTFLLAAFLLAFTACKEAAKTADQVADKVEEAAEDVAEKATGVMTEGNERGEAFEVKDPLSYDALLVTMAQTDSVQVQVKGVVDEVCQMKGCWMTIKPTSDGHDPIMVKFKDYAYFMPFDLSGGEVIMNGWAYRDVTPVDELRHYAEDAGKSAEEIAAITEPKEELKILASGVKIVKPGTGETETH